MMDATQASNILISERKRGIPANYFLPPIEPELDEGEEIVATLNGMDIIIDEPKYALRVYSMGNYGTFAGQRMNFPNFKCFEPSPSNCSIGSNASLNLPLERSETIAFEQARNWISRKTGGGLLHLSPMEALYLFHEIGAIKIHGSKLDQNSTASDIFNLFKSIFGPQFVRIYIVYRYFRRLGWIVRDGISFGINFLLYKDSIELHHACSGVRILDSITEPVVTGPAIHAAIRALNNCKKGLLVVVAEMPPTMAMENNIWLADLELAKIQILSMSKWNANKSRTNDLE